MHIWALGLSCETPAAPPDRAAGARTRQPENSKRAHLRVPALQTPPKFHEKDKREGKKNKNCGRRGKKKREILGPHPSGLHPSGLHPSGLHPSGLHPLGAPTLRAPPFGAPPFGVPPFWLHPSGPHFFWVWPPHLLLAPLHPPCWAPTLPGPLQNKKLAKVGQHSETLKLAKCGLAKFGQQKLAKCGPIRMAKSGLAKCGSRPRPSAGDASTPSQKH